MSTPRLRLLAVLAAFGLIAFLTLNPGWVIGPLRGAVVGELLAVTGGFGPGVDLDRDLNTALFLPFGAAVAASVPRRWSLVGALAGFVVSAAVELAQSTIPGRVEDPSDVVWNTAGAAAGALIVALLRLLRAGRARPRASAETAPPGE
jgi:hypothetical protein